ncbi:MULTISPECIES: type IV toxin-antitoxin system AbiEi family antitoxin domain-containing protein [Rhizobium]|uniref:type IV toxin-antitoxin system AbiEi family antitoxin domain-containing protein n=1 Tax=Rhizobium TaxID=379 RepID=UPI0019579C9A|nr:type IV toxin-antitoxin system AbiEi family antitoxin domain-containing protein [Rhizobium lusitanum]MBM7046634.1 type IV toxin-antitoxin system AbiEi family antitoxin domain-containing protein [Rhizobium lusitanum]
MYQSASPDAVAAGPPKDEDRAYVFVFAGCHTHPWREFLNPDDFNLGTGDRALAKGNKIHPLYRIMVPSEFGETLAGSPDGP